MNTRSKSFYAKGARLALYAMLIVALLFQSVVVAPMLNNVQAQETNTWKFVSETVPDNSCFTPGAPFTKSWTIRNVGSAIWNPAYSLVFTSGDQLSAPNAVQLTLLNVGLNNEITVSVNMTAPMNAGIYTSNWAVKDANGGIVMSTNGKSSLWAQIKVAADCSAIAAATNVPQNGVITLPPLKDGEFRQIDAGHVQFGYGGITYDATPSPDNVYAIPGQSGTIEFFTVRKCAWSPTWFDWGRQECHEEPRYFRDLGLPPAWTIDATAERQFYSFLNAVVPFGAFGTIQSGTLTGVNGWKWVEVGSAETVSRTAISTALKGLARTGLFIVPAYLIMAGRVFVPVRDYAPIAVPVPIAPPYLTLQETASGLLGIPGIIQMENSVITVEVLLNNAEGCHINMGLESDYTPNKDPLQSNIRETVKHSGPCNKSDIRYLIESLIRQVREFIEYAKKILNDPLSYSATAKDIAAMKVIVEQFPKIVHELLVLLLSL